ncbi:unnamed protein product [Brassicogethes aeneus]|uniref:Uncharacterized protein n=1 Tax=Brassicogethes aeneus TaxID=1431903 RepID=A0A9P0B3K4_BRAAE|nr:unnamed protein product [Brassicogethes aeneus]
MSGQSNQSTPGRMQKSSPNSCKQGPLKATIPISSVLKQNSGLISDNSPNISPTCNWKARYSPDPAFGQRSPGSPCNKEKSKLDGHCEGKIRRTASLDTIYLKGHWPRDHFFWHTGTLQINKSTQTEDSDYIESRKIQCISESGDKVEKVMAWQKIKGNREPLSRHGSPDTLNTSSQTLASSILSPTMKAIPMNIPCKPMPKSSMRNSVEGLNQEIERIVLKTCTVGMQFGADGDMLDDYRKFSQSTPEGHRAPHPDMFRAAARSRSVNTQTPNDFSEGSSAGSSPDREIGKLGTSPHINRFLAREPPDGCERVSLKSLDDELPKQPTAVVAQQPLTMFKLRSSLGSAFQLLQPNSVEHHEHEHAQQPAPDQ